MTLDDGARAILLTGVYGAGKTSVAEEVAALLEERNPPFAAIDLDWLAWSNVAGSGHDGTTLLSANLAAVAANFRAAGARRFVLAGSVEDAATLDAIRHALAMPLLVVRLEVPLEVVEARLGRSPTSGRADDLATARAWFVARPGHGLEDAVLDGTAPLRDTATQVVRVAGWHEASSG
jgi:chloramphenicol 3-O-phosphotransferase